MYTQGTGTNIGKNGVERVIKVVDGFNEVEYIMGVDDVSI